MDAHDPLKLPEPTDEAGEEFPFAPGKLAGLRPNQAEIDHVMRSYSERTIFKAWLLYFVLSWCGTLGIVFGYALYLGFIGGLQNDPQAQVYPSQWFAWLSFLVWIPASLGAFFVSVRLLLPKPA